MTDAKDDGGPAFERQTRMEMPVAYTGMTLRDWFAGQALAGMLAGGPAAEPVDYAVDAYSVADAMMVERKL